MGSGPALGSDLGGGSLEIVAGAAERIDLATSVPVGAARLRGEVGASDPLTAEQSAEIVGGTRRAPEPRPRRRCRRAWRRGRS